MKLAPILITRVRSKLYFKIWIHDGNPLYTACCVTIPFNLDEKVIFQCKTQMSMLICDQLFTWFKSTKAQIT